MASLHQGPKVSKAKPLIKVNIPKISENFKNVKSHFFEKVLVHV
jgi:hypothetical protein